MPRLVTNDSPIARTFDLSERHRNQFTLSVPAKTMLKIAEQTTADADDEGAGSAVGRAGCPDEDDAEAAAASSGPAGRRKKP